MTKKFALPDTHPDPYFTIDAGVAATLTVKVCRIKDDRMMVEIWRDEKVLCRLLADSIVVEKPEL